VTKLLSTPRAILLLSLSGIFGTSSFAQIVQPTILTFNVNDPTKIAVVGGGSFLVAEAGSRPNFGTILFFDQFGDQAPLVLGLPSAGRNPLTGGPSGPDGLVVSGSNILFVATAQLVAPGGWSDPNQSSILKLNFTRPLANEPGPFALNPSADYQKLLNGNTVTLNQGADNTVNVSLAVASTSKINGLTVDNTTNRLYIVSRVDGTISYIPLFD